MTIFDSDSRPLGSSPSTTPQLLRATAERSVAAALVGIIVLLPAAVAGQTPDLSDPVPPDPEALTGKLDNGLVYFVRENDEPEQRAFLRLVVNAGSILEDEDQLGLAHFVEHMAFNGTRNFAKQELVDYLESIGMAFGPHINASTSFDETIYMLQVPTDDPEAMDTAFRILEDWAAGLAFDPEEVDKERGVVIEEWRGRLGAADRIFNEQMPLIFEGSLYAERLPIGDPDILENAPTEALRRFYDDWYRPDLMAVIAVGDFDGAEIERTIRERFAGLEGPADPRPRFAPETPVDHPARAMVSTDPEQGQTSVVVMYKQEPQRTVTVGDFRRDMVQSMYSSMLGDRFQERAMQADPPFVAAAGSRGSLVRGVGAHQLFALIPEGGVARGFEAALLEAERASRYGFAESELERRKLAMARSYERQLAEKDNRSSGSFVNQYIQAYLRGGIYPSVEARVELSRLLLPGIALEEVNAAGPDWLAEEGRVLLVDAPAKEGSEPPPAQTLTDIFASVAAAEIEPYVDEMADQPLLAEIPEGSEVVAQEVIQEVGITIWTLNNGVRVVLKPTDFRDDQILFRATSPGGSSLFPDEEYAEITAAAGLIGSSGVGEFDATELGKKLTGKVASASPSISSLSEGMSGSASPKDLETALQLVYLYFVAPRMDEDLFAAQKAMIEGMIGSMGNSPSVVFGDTVSLTMSQNHPRTGSYAETMASFRNADLARGLVAYKDRFADASDFTFYFVGSFDPPTIRPLIERYLGSLPNLGREETWRDTGIDPPGGVIEKVVRKGVEPQSQTRIIFAGEAEYSREEWAAVAAMGDALEITLREILREDLGGTYSVGVGTSLSYRPDEEYMVSIQFGSAPERAEELADAVFEAIETMKAEGPNEETVQKVKEADRRAKETNLRQNGYWLTQLGNFETAGLDLRLIPSYRWIEGWTAEDVRQAAIKYLRTDHYAKFVLLPEEGGGS